MLTEDSLFSECSNNNKGGSLCYQSQGQCAQNRICGYKSALTVNDDRITGVYCHIWLSQGGQYYNKIFDSSIIFSGFGNKMGICNIQSIFGTLQFSSLNTSSTDMFGNSINALSNLNGYSTVKYSTFESNTDTSENLSSIAFYSQSHQIKADVISCNYINNFGNALFMYSDTILLVKNSNFLNNKGYSLDFRGGYGSVTLEDCYINYAIKTQDTFYNRRQKSEQNILQLTFYAKCTKKQKTEPIIIESKYRNLFKISPVLYIE